MQDTASCITPTLLIAILHPHGVPHLKGKVGQLALIAAIGIHEPQLLAAATVGHKDDLRAIGRPSGVFVPRPFIVGQLHGRPLAFAHQPQRIVATLVGDQDDHIGGERPAGLPGIAGAKAGETLCHHCYRWSDNGILHCQPYCLRKDDHDDVGYIAGAS